MGKVFKIITDGSLPIVLLFTTRNGIYNKQQFQACLVLHTYCIKSIMDKAGQLKPKNWKARLMHWLGLTNEVTIKVYHGYGHAEQITVYGHVFQLSPLPRKKY